jgi:hypothetical protein
MVEIVNMHGIKDMDGFWVDRRSPVGNPYYMKNENERDSVCDRYEVYFAKSMEENKRFANYIEMLVMQYKKNKNIKLLCWCYPKRCHAETIKKYIEEHV